VSDEKWINLLLPRFRYGNIEPPAGGQVRRPGYQFYRLVPMDIMEIAVGLGIKDYTPEGVEEAIDNFWPRVSELVEQNVDWIVLGGAPVSSQLGRPRVLELVQQVRQRHGLQLDTPMEAIIAALKHLGINRVTVASRWADQLNNALKTYLESAGVEVLAITSRGQWAGQAFTMSLEQGLQMALDVGREAARLAPDAGAILVPGGAAMSLHTIPALEEEFGKPVLTNLNSEVWNALIRPGVIEPIRGWGRLLAGER
jgi:arylmalonate decarboxylase